MRPFWGKRHRITVDLIERPKRLFAAALAAGFGLVAATAVAAAAYGWAAAYVGFSPLCHQKPERCLAVGGMPMPMCARSLAIVAGLAVGSLGYAILAGRLRARRGWLGVATLALAGDVLLEWAGLYENVAALRVATGLSFGFALAAVSLVCSPSPARRALAGQRRFEHQRL